MSCIVCKKRIEALPEPEGELNPDYIPPPNMDEYVNETNWNDGVVDFVVPGYGSNHDMSQFRIAICDECLTRETEAGVIHNLGECFPTQQNIDAWSQRLKKIRDFQTRLKAYEGREELWFPDDLYYLMKDALEYIEQRG